MQKNTVSSGLSNKLVGQIGEFLVCAELGRQGLIATPFAGNVPAFDVLAVDEKCRSVPIQVKASTGNTWLTDAQNWMTITFELDKVEPSKIIGQKISPLIITNPNLIYVHVRVAQKPEERDRFWVLTKADLQKICVKAHGDFLARHNGLRPKNPESLHLAYSTMHLKEYENNWHLVRDQMEQHTTQVDPLAAP